MRTETVTSATGEPLTLEEVKTHLRLEVGETNEDEYLEDLIVSARQRVEAITGRSLMPQQKYVYLDDWEVDNEDYIHMPDPPLRSITSTGVRYTDSDGDSTTFSSTSWSEDTVSIPGRLVLEYGESWPTVVLNSNNPIRIRYNCGYSTRAAIPRAIKTAMKILVADMYENRELHYISQGQSIANIDTVDALLSPYRVWKWNV
jgi:uncharacterized phiE125 gp8 family phage protein